MSFPTDWDVEKYRVGYESDEHWELRKNFVVKHKKKFPEDKLICLAQVFYNVEFLGCRYPKATMKLVESLSKGIVEDHREKMKGRLKRTFVGASDAASSKVKGLRSSVAAAPDKKSGICINTLSRTTNQNCMQSNLIKFEPATQDVPDTTPVATLNQKSTQSKPITIELSPDTTLTNEPIVTKKKRKKKKKINPSSSMPENVPCSNAVCPKPLMSSTSEFSSYKDVILYFREQDTTKAKLLSSCSFNKMPLEMSSEFQEKLCLYTGCVKICGKEVGTGTGATALHAQEAAANAALNNLSKHCYTILVKNTFVVQRKVEKHEIINCQPGLCNEAEAVSDDKASRMMKMMGWSGGGLGKEEQGRTEPVMPVHQNRRAGVGSTVNQIKFKNLKEILIEFIKSGSTHDIVFSTDFDNSERKEIHTVANKLGLKSQSRSKGENRFLVVSRKWKPRVLLSVLLDARNTSERYTLLPPSSTEEVSAEEQRHRNEEIQLRELQKETAKIHTEKERARMDEDISYNQYEVQLQKLKEDMNKHCKTTITAEADETLLAALRGLVAQKETELVVYHRDKQWKPVETVRAPVGFNSTITHQISSDLEQISKKVEDLRKQSQRLNVKRIEADKIVIKLRAYSETEKNATFEMERIVKVLFGEHRKEKEAPLIASDQVRPICPPLASSLQQSTRRSAILTELDEEKIRGGNLTKELCEVVQQAAENAARREQWLKRQFSKDEQTPLE